MTVELTDFDVKYRHVSLLDVRNNGKAVKGQLTYYLVSRLHCGIRMCICVTV